jgi:hypothetical protein
MIVVGVCSFSLSLYFIPSCIICEVKPSVSANDASFHMILMEFGHLFVIPI